MNKGEAYNLRRAIVKGAESLPVETAVQVPVLYDRWTVGEVFELENGKVPFIIRRYNGVLYKLVQVHTTQSDWTPDIAPALWKKYIPEDVIADWVQPTGAHDAYNIGDKVRFNGKVYESLINANVYSPTEYPQGWKEVV